MKSKEALIQVAIIQWAQLHKHIAPELQWLHHIPNGGSRHAREAVNLKKQGVVPGILDLFLPAARHGYHGFYLEIKHGKNDLTSSQRDYSEYLTEQNYLARVYWDAWKAQDDLAWYLGIKKRARV